MTPWFLTFYPLAYEPEKVVSVPAPSEKDIQDQCLQFLRYVLKAVAVRINGGAMKIGNRYVRFNDTGGEGSTSDILACLPTDGRFAGIEVKREGEYPTEKQSAFLAAVEAAGGLAIVAHSLDELREALGKEGYGVGQ